MVNANLKTAITTLPAETGSQLRLVASLESGSTNLHEFLHKYYALEPSAYPTDIILVIGPEGDLSVDEYKLCSSNGFKPVSLGSSTLRVETAAICSAFSINNFFNRE
jgi:16S rRNA (uracil1498-N3)-methyltransferase